MAGDLSTTTYTRCLFPTELLLLLLFLSSDVGTRDEIGMVTFLQRNFHRTRMPSPSFGWRTGITNPPGI